MKYIFIFLLGLGILNGCSSIDSEQYLDRQKAANCPEPPPETPKIKINSQKYNLYNTFNYQIEEIIASRDTIAFTSLNYQFTWCRANDSWIVESIDTQADSDNNTKTESDRKIQLEGKIYQYQVRLDRQTDEARQAIFELTTPQSNRSQQQILYTLEQTKQAGAGIQLGEPEISQPIIYGDRLFWSVYTYHGEGFGGIATIISYNPATDEIEVIQPPEIAGQIINDLVISGQPNNPTFWIATQLTGEGNPYIPSLGLVAYRPDGEDYTQGTIDSYRVDNSPIVGAIPTKLHLEDDKLWIGTGNGICQVNWQAIDNADSWNCWRFALMAELPDEELPVYSSSLDDTVAAVIPPDNTDPLEVLWWSFQQREPVEGRYEIRYEPSLTVEIDRGATTWTELYRENYQPPVWEPPVYWAGSDWHWFGNRFVRGFDEVGLNVFGGGPTGIDSQKVNNDYVFDHYAMRGDLELLKLTQNTTKVKYYSAWVEDELLQPYLTIVPQMRSPQSQPNPLLKIESFLN